MHRVALTGSLEDLSKDFFFTFDKHLRSECYRFSLCQRDEKIEREHFYRHFAATMKHAS